MSSRKRQQAEKALGRVEMMIDEIATTIAAHQLEDGTIQGELALENLKDAGADLMRHLRVPEGI